MPTAIDLFSGCGGLTLGLKKAGFQIIGAVEIEPLAAEAYGRNHSEVLIWKKDIRRIPVTHVQARLGIKKGQLDLLAGCPPCQGFSTVRTLNGSRRVRDARNDLIFDFLRFAKKLKPKVLLLENVPGLRTDKRFKRFWKVLVRMGYELEFRVLDAADYGVPQRRRRLILLASRIGTPTFCRRSRIRRTVRDAIGGLPHPQKFADPLHQRMEERSFRIRKLIERIPKDGGSRSSLGTRTQLKCHRNCNGFKDIYGRMAWDDVAPTITTGCLNPSKGRFLHPSQNRAITLREAAILQGFPKRYRFPLERGRYCVANLLGNAIPSEFIERQGHQIARLLKRNT